MDTTTEGPPIGERTALARARGIVLAVLTLDVLVLLVTGIVLFLTYRPEPDPAFGGVTDDGLRSSIDLARATTTVHRSAAWLAVPTAVAAGVLFAIEERRPRARRLDVALGIGLAVVVTVASVTGFLLPWDQLAVWAVTVGSDVRGYRPLLDDDRVRFVIVDGALLAPGTVVRWLVVHTLVVGAALAALLGTAWRRSLSR